MALVEARDAEQAGIRSVIAARIAGAEAVAMLAEAERLKARAVAGLIDFGALDAHVAEGFATPERRLAVLGNVVDREAVRLQRVVRFCAQHTLVADALEAGEITVDHADVLRAAAVSVGAELFNDDVLDLLRAANGVDFSVFNDRITDWTWRKTPEATEDGIEQQFNNRYLSMQGDIFGGVKGSFKLDAAGAAVVAEALETTPDPDSGTDSAEPTGARRTASNVDVLLDLPTLLGVPFDLDNHRDESGEVDWNSIQQSFTATGSAPRPVLAQFFCDASYRQLITSGPRIVLDYNKATPDIPRALRRAIQRRDGCCQFAGCDRAVRFAHYWSCSANTS